MELAGPLGTPLGLAQLKRASPRGEAGNSVFLSVSDSDRRVPAELGQESQASSREEAKDSALLSSRDAGLLEPPERPQGSPASSSVSDSDRRVPAELGQESQASSCLRKGTPLASRVTQGVSGPSSSCVWNPRVFADDARGWQCPFVLCLHPQGCLRRGVRSSGPSQGRTGESGAFGMWPHPRGSSRISS